jgi:hypoxanthine phosphoribosyltransferase
VNDIHPDIQRVLYSKEAIRARVAQMAQTISADYSGVHRLYLVGILKGAFIFLADLCRELTVPHTVDFMAVSSYGKAAVSGAVRLVLDVREPIAGEHVMIVEDIVDTGQTLQYLHHTLQGREPASLRTCAFLRKERPGNDFPIDYLGFEIPDVWVVGYGLDFGDRHRTLPYIGELRRDVYQGPA